MGILLDRDYSFYSRRDGHYGYLRASQEDTDATTACKEGKDTTTVCKKEKVYSFFTDRFLEGIYVKKSLFFFQVQAFACQLLVEVGYAEGDDGGYGSGMLLVFGDVFGV